MDNYVIKTCIEAEILCAVSHEDICVLATSNSLIYYQESEIVIPWFSTEDLQVQFIDMNSSFVSILAKNGSVLIFPLYTLAGPQFLPAWRKFIAKGFSTLISYSTSDENILDVIGGCLTGRSRRFENHLEATILKIKSNFFSGMVWSSNYLIISLKTEILIISTVNGQLVKKAMLKFNIYKIEHIENNLLAHSDDCYYIFNIQELINNKNYQGKNVFWSGKACCTLDKPLIYVLYDNKIEVFTIEQVLVPEMIFLLPKKLNNCVFWNKCIVGFDEELVVIGKILSNYVKRLNKPLAHKKICLCEDCCERDEKIDYEQWIRRDKESSVLWTHKANIGKVLEK